VLSYRYSFAKILLLTAMISFIGFSPASSRIWKASPDQIAKEYAIINDSRPNGEFVVLTWFVPTMVRPDTSEANIMIAALKKYVVVTAAHGQLDKTTAKVTFLDIDALEAKDQDARPLTPVARDDLPPTTAGMLITTEAFFRQSLGALGKGLKMFVFDAGAVDSCKKGRLSVPFAGETYTWETPIPGCPQR